MNEDMEEIMIDLLSKKAVYGLTANEETRLAEMQKRAGVADDSLSFELAAAAIAAAETGNSETMPAHLKSRITADAARYFSASAAAPIPRRVRETAGRASFVNLLGWAVAAAACLALALNVYFTRQERTVVRNGPAVTPGQRLSLVQERERLISLAPDLARGTWGAGNVKDVTPSGDIVWSDADRRGFMRLSGLPKNDPSIETYQLWIFDDTQDEKTPIDGGVFNITTDGEVIVPIDAKLIPRNTKMYAITIEKPGGVVVSNRARIVALAKRET